MLDFKVGLSVVVPVVLTNTQTGLGHVGVAAANVTVTVIKSNGSTATFVPSGAQWVEFATGAFVGSGYYNLTVSSSHTDQAGMIQYGVAAPGDAIYFGVANLVANLESDTYARIGAPAGASVSADIASAGANASAAATNAAVAAAQASSAASQATAAASQATSANTNATAAASSSAAALGSIGSRFVSGSLSADLSATYHAATNISASVGSGTVNASVDLTPVLVALTGVRNTLGQPVVSIARDILECARLTCHPPQSKR